MQAEEIGIIRNELGTSQLTFLRKSTCISLQPWVASDNPQHSVSPQRFEGSTILDAWQLAIKESSALNLLSTLGWLVQQGVGQRS